MTRIRPLAELLKEANLDPEWRLKAFASDDCVSYVAWNTGTREALVVDPKDLDLDAYRATARELKGYLWLGVFDTHTHADHISAASVLATEVGAPLVMHAASPSPRVQIRVAKDTHLPARSSPVEIILTPGHTGDSVTIVWGPFLFGGDTLLFDDTGRDDLPGGSAEAHYESIQKLKARLKPEMILLPGHDREGGRVSTWADQLKTNSSLSESREEFVRSSNEFQAPAPQYLKESLRENFR